MSELVFFMLGSVITLLAIATVVIYKEDQERYDRVQKRNTNRSQYNGTV